MSEKTEENEHFEESRLTPNQITLTAIESAKITYHAEFVEICTVDHRNVHSSRKIDQDSAMKCPDNHSQKLLKYGGYVLTITGYGTDKNNETKRIYAYLGLPTGSIGDIKKIKNF